MLRATFVLTNGQKVEVGYANGANDHPVVVNDTGDEFSVSSADDATVNLAHFPKSGVLFWHSDEAVIVRG